VALATALGAVAAAGVLATADVGKVEPGGCVAYVMGVAHAKMRLADGGRSAALGIVAATEARHVHADANLVMVKTELCTWMTAMKRLWASMSLVVRAGGSDLMGEQEGAQRAVNAPEAWMGNGMLRVEARAIVQILAPMGEAAAKSRVEGQVGEVRELTWTAKSGIRDLRDHAEEASEVV